MAMGQTSNSASMLRAEFATEKVQALLRSVEFSVTYVSSELGLRFAQVLQNQEQTNRVLPYKRDLKALTEKSYCPVAAH